MPYFIVVVVGSVVVAIVLVVVLLVVLVAFTVVHPMHGTQLAMPPQPCRIVVDAMLVVAMLVIEVVEEVCAVDEVSAQAGYGEHG